VVWPKAPTVGAGGSLQFVSTLLKELKESIFSGFSSGGRFL
jgi:hypothetical protein